MADIGRQHHHNLLSEGLHADEDHAKLGAHIDPDIIKLALKESANNTSPGYDGIPYEFWKMLLGDPNYNLRKAKNKDQTNKENPDPDPEIVQSLTEVYLDIEMHGVHPDSAFAEGWMCPRLQNIHKSAGDKARKCSPQCNPPEPGRLHAWEEYI
ncbi:hypothetical protein PILCRDRAFT_817853 [Piloderma croceum F 1598]|uniref:Uncharacterized protein n=1 Tax=Piloderma croceum (strain F 1598) TaxID=765440 RepID=A0A0C3C5T1_PILCF|nr:hypothetical protein PILCRDRAFT_817853 [Piloderma croceum F 1598]